MIKHTRHFTLNENTTKDNVTFILMNMGACVSVTSNSVDPLAQTNRKVRRISQYHRTTSAWRLQGSMNSETHGTIQCNHCGGCKTSKLPCLYCLNASESLDDIGLYVSLKAGYPQKSNCSKLMKRCHSMPEDHKHTMYPSSNSVGGSTVITDDSY